MFKKNQIKSFFFISFALLFLIQCNSSPTEPGPVCIDLTQPWETSTSFAMGMDQDKLSLAIKKAAENPRFLSLLVVRRGRLVIEEYFNGNRANDLNDVRSVTKSIVSSLVGIALAEGFISSLDETLGQYLYPHVAAMNEDKQAISVRHLLTMTGGFSWDESGGYGDYIPWINSNDHIQFVINRSLVYAPGTYFTYNSAAVHLLGVLITEATDMTLPDFADQYLFSKIGIEQSQWEMLSGGYVNGGAGIDLLPRDLARFGQLYLQGGISGTTQVLPPNWVAQTSTPKFDWRDSYGALDSFTYGYLWWIEEGQADKMYFAWGFGGQFIFVVPEEELVIVTTTNWRNISVDGGPDPLQHVALNIIINGVATAVR
jgi:CubicO group peptidase (beta-lactamase class C family)